MKALKTYGGLPVPFTVAWENGKPDFRKTDINNIARCVNFGLCAICGHKLGLMAYYLGGPLCAENHLFNDPAMHEDCARQAMQLCPFVSGRKSEYRGELPMTPLQDASGRPTQMHLMRGLTSAQCWAKVGDDGTLTIYAGRQLMILESF